MPPDDSCIENESWLWHANYILADIEIFQFLLRRHDRFSAFKLQTRILVSTRIVYQAHLLYIPLDIKAIAAGLGRLV